MWTSLRNTDLVDPYPQNLLTNISCLRRLFFTLFSIKFHFFMLIFSKSRSCGQFCVTSTFFSPITKKEWIVDHLWDREWPHYNLILNILTVSYYCRIQFLSWKCGKITKRLWSSHSFVACWLGSCINTERRVFYSMINCGHLLIPSIYLPCTWHPPHINKWKEHKY